MHTCHGFLTASDLCADTPELSDSVFCTIVSDAVMVDRELAGMRRSLESLRWALGATLSVYIRLGSVALFND
jgi:hypothetical protein